MSILSNSSCITYEFCFCDINLKKQNKYWATEQIRSLECKKKKRKKLINFVFFVLKVTEISVLKIKKKDVHFLIKKLTCIKNQKDFNTWPLASGYPQGGTFLEWLYCYFNLTVELCIPHVSKLLTSWAIPSLGRWFTNLSQKHGDAFTTNVAFGPIFLNSNHKRQAQTPDLWLMPSERKKKPKTLFYLCSLQQIKARSAPRCS